MVRARVRPDIDRLLIPAVTHATGIELMIKIEGEFDAEQPDLCEDHEYNTLISLPSGLFWVASIDLEFEPFRT